MGQLDGYFILVKKNKVKFRGFLFLTNDNLCPWIDMSSFSYRSSVKFGNAEDIQWRLDSGEIPKDPEFAYFAFQVNQLK